VELLILLVLLPLIFYLGFAVRGMVLSQGWSWFLATPFGLPEISIWHAAGIGLLIGMVTQGLQREDFNKEALDNNAWKLIARVFVNPLFTLLIMWIVKGIAF
jgi:hypothetical protein